ncbi:MAG: DASS family sodium-coupled anion symporter [Candidatus Diapherotrites archaeon]|nr:DASS family sodium-coupled anion symporter [Candidatus Micrarchaeota archaeon]MBU1939261.1 DASS family sodium-coupled anion symporter [Candidatus Micrarchaeota archaeon]
MLPNQKKALHLALGLLLAGIAYFLPLGLPTEARLVLAITAIAMVWWFTEALPLHATALAVSFLLVVVAGFTPKDVFAPYFDPVIVLLLGGFVLALALHKYKIDEMVAFEIVNRVGHTPGRVLFGLMVVSAFMSMWMSNTASTAIMLPIVIFILAKNGLKPLKSNYGKALILGVAYAATIGGIATLVGSPPNPIAASFLREQGIAMGFTEWMAYGLPFVILFLPIAWFVLKKMFPAEKGHIKIEKTTTKFSAEMKIVLGVFALTVLLWLTTGIHGVASSMVSIVPIILLYVLGLINTADFSKINWAALILIGGGLSLGSALQASGLDLFVAGIMQSVMAGHGFFIVALIVIGFAILLTMIASNTAAAALMIPMMIPLAPLLGIDVKILVMLAAIGVSLDFIVPVGTPPSAIAYSSGYIKTKDMAIAGTALAILGAVLLAALAAFTW